MSETPCWVGLSHRDYGVEKDSKKRKEPGGGGRLRDEKSEPTGIGRGKRDERNKSSSETKVTVPVWS